MIIHHEELALARNYETAHDFEGLTNAQMKAIMTRGRELFHWFKAHRRTHNAINLCVLVLLLAGSYLVLMKLPAVFLPPGQEHSVGTILLASAVCGSLHSYLLYSLGTLSLHEGAAHKIIFVGNGPLARRAQTVAEHLCRLANADPDYYSTSHMTHHAKFGTDEDPEFLNFVIPRRYFLTFVPLATFINFTDFVVHRPLTYTRSRVISSVVSIAYNGTYAYLVYRTYGFLFMLAMFVFLPHVGFYFDRLRQFTEHNLMPLENSNGSRSFGTGFWGLLIGGGPWGSPCHWEHHLVPSLPWYQQLALHRYVVRLLTPRQREQFLIRPVVGFPLLWWRIVRDLQAFSRRPVTLQVHATSVTRDTHPGS